MRNEQAHQPMAKRYCIGGLGDQRFKRLMTEGQ